MVDVQTDGKRHRWVAPTLVSHVHFYSLFCSVEIENTDEDLLPEVVLGDFVWLDDTLADIRYEARIAKSEVFQRGHACPAVLKMSLGLPEDFNLELGALFVLRFRINRITLRRQYHALASLSTATFPGRLLFPSAADIRPIPRLSRAEINNLYLVNGRIRGDDQQLRTVVSILEQPRASVPFIVFGP